MKNLLCVPNEPNTSQELEKSLLECDVKGEWVNVAPAASPLDAQSVRAASNAIDLGILGILTDTYNVCECESVQNRVPEPV